MTQEIDRTQLFKSMAAIRAELSTFERDKVNSHFKYGYASAAQVFEKIGAVMAAHDLCVFPAMITVDVSDDNKRYRIGFEFTIACGKSGASVTMPWFGESMVGSDDKALNKAATTALKYFLMSMFVVSSDDNVETDQDGAGTTKPVRGKSPFNQKRGNTKPDTVKSAPKKVSVQVWEKPWVQAHFRDEGDFMSTVKALIESGKANTDMDTSALATAIYEYAVLDNIKSVDVKKAREDWRTYILQQVQAQKIDPTLDAKALMSALADDIDFWIPA